MTTMKQLGQLLVEKGRMTPAQLEEALKGQRTTGEFLGAWLIRKGWITEGQLLEALSEQFGMPCIDLSPQAVNWDLPKQFPPDLLQDHLCFPFAQDELSMTVAIANPLDAWTISALDRQARGRRIQLVLAPRKQIEEAVREFYRRAMARIEKSLQGGSP